jgi:hypothetical protein
MTELPVVVSTVHSKSNAIYPPLMILLPTTEERLSWLFAVAGMVAVGAMTPLIHVVD